MPAQRVIKTFRSAETASLFSDLDVPRFSAIERAARRRLPHLHRTRVLDDSRAPLGNRLEALNGNRKGQYSIRVNDRWRICFRWQDASTWEVEIVDCH